ncbi:hypothetical protein EKO04_000007 [Ascochyta lentis]|uniref:Uncharacterized protein n=1 Tax=Ascochyta lentis TaxID=205686 RepID=A0A8H7ML49_9PLEO|nr:hypothetical protein EKO04_000007 [Ascochyta lentis]
MDYSSVAPPARSELGGQDLHAIGMIELLEHDPRPTFVLNGTILNQNCNIATSLAYWNLSLASINEGDLLVGIKDDSAIITAEKHSQIRSEFRAWIATDVETTKSCVFLGYTWTKLVLASHWIVVFGAPTNTSPHEGDAQLEHATLTRTLSGSSIATFDWTDELPPARMSSHVAWARSIDWSQTPLGPTSNWPHQLRSISNIIMQDSRPAVVFYGPELTMIYNEAYTDCLGNLHPCMGSSAQTALATVWSDFLAPIIAQNRDGEVVEQTDTLVNISRNGFLEETYFNVKFMPMLDSSGATVGHYVSASESSRGVVSERQSQTLLHLSEELSHARDIDSYWNTATEVFSRNDKDVLFLLLYSVEYDPSESITSATPMSREHRQCKLRGSVGLPEDKLAGPAYLDLSKDQGFTPYLRQATTAQQPITVSFDGDLAIASLFQDIPWRGFGDACRAAVVSTLNPISSKDNVLGFMVVGLNPRRPYDDDYRQFLFTAGRLLSTPLASILVHDEDIRRREIAVANAETMRIELKRQLLNTQIEVERSMFKFQRFAEGADIGIFILSLDGIYSYRNEAWYSILGAGDRSIQLEPAWEALIDEEHIAFGQEKFQALIDTKEHQSFELRLKRTSMQCIGDSEPQEQQMWVLCSIFPDMKSDGEVEAMIGCFTDISQQKWGEQIQAAHALNAQESKRQLETFIDTTSHEMRNPLSAIVQCADSIISTHKAFEGSPDSQHTIQSILDAAIDSAETIVQCSKHMKTIVDDVLTMSKIDSGLFTMTPVDVQLESIARNAVKMFEGEAQAAGIELNLRLQDSCKECNIKEVSLDPNRVLQILINLLTNAIKFTHLEQTRQITISLGISLEEPVEYAQDHVKFVRTSEALATPSLQADWDKGGIVYIIFAVQDTGRGLSGTERDLLFARFSQASARTHIDYGGSGLGLFISRRLTEMHGGAIGFASEAGVGSTFAFYVKSRNTTSSLKSESESTTTHLSIREQAPWLSSKPCEDTNQSPVQPIKNPIPTTNLHVLVVEDNLVNQRVLTKQLRKLGIEVSVANHGGEALNHLHTTTWCISDAPTAKKLSLVLMDWEMPIMDGLTCVRRIRDLEQQGVIRGHVPVIAVTANVRSEQVKTAMKAGMDNVISKPFRIPELLARMEETLGARVLVE